jgi:hypothetical protein
MLSTGTKSFAYGGVNTLLQKYIEDTSNPRKSSAANITSTYNSGYMTGDIKGAWLSDTDTTNVVGTELVTNGDFSNGNTGWINVYATSINASGGQITIIDDGDGNWGWAKQTLNLVTNKIYTVTIDLESESSSAAFRLSASTNSYPYQDNIYLTSGINTFTITPESSSAVHILIGGTGTSVFNSITIREADADRSVNANGLQVNGTITKTAVATGADLVAYSGFSASNYLVQPYNADTQFGTGDFSITYWINDANIAKDARHVWLNHDKTTTTEITEGFSIGMWMSNIRILGAIGVRTTTASYAANVWNQISVVRESGVLNIYVNGSVKHSSAFAVNVSTTKGTLIGQRYDGGHPPALATKFALLRISATAPTAAQIKEIYEAEKPLFQENAKCTLNGSSDAVQCLAYDDSTELLHVGTSGGRSTFQGLRRVDETATNTTEISAQGGMIIEETA